MIVNAANFQRYFATYGLATIWGDNLASTTISATTAWPKKLGETEVFGNDVPLGLLFVSPTQINFQLSNNTGTVNIRVVNGPNRNPASFAIDVQSRWPAIFEMGYDCAYNPLWNDPSPCGLSARRTHEQQPTRGAVTDPDGNLLLSSAPARLNGTYTVWFTGLGGPPAVNPPPPSYWPEAYVGGLPHGGLKYLTITYVGQSQFPGLYQMNFRIPPEIMGSLYPSGEDTRPTCADYRIELSLFISSSSTNRLTSLPVQIPLLAKNGEFSCLPSVRTGRPR